MRIPSKQFLNPSLSPLPEELGGEISAIRVACRRRPWGRAARIAEALKAMPLGRHDRTLLDAPNVAVRGAARAAMSGAVSTGVVGYWVPHGVSCRPWCVGQMLEYDVLGNTPPPARV